jgi:hypothetical protein
MAGIAVLAVGLAAWLSGSFAWFTALYGVTIFALLMATVAARYRPATHGAFWFGFAVFGWGYFLIGISPWTDWKNSIAPGGFQPRANPLLPTDILLRRLADYQSVHQMPQIPEKNITFSPTTGRKANFTDQEMSAYITACEKYVDATAYNAGVGHLITIWILGGAGGLFARYIAGYSRPGGQT